MRECHLLLRCVKISSSIRTHAVLNSGPCYHTLWSRWIVLGRFSAGEHLLIMDWYQWKQSKNTNWPITRKNWESVSHFPIKKNTSGIPWHPKQFHSLPAHCTICNRDEMGENVHCKLATFSQSQKPMSLLSDIVQYRLLGDKVCNFIMTLSSGEPQSILALAHQTGAFGKSAPFWVPKNGTSSAQI